MNKPTIKFNFDDLEVSNPPALELTSFDAYKESLIEREADIKFKTNMLVVMIENRADEIFEQLRLARWLGIVSGN